MQTEIESTGVIAPKKAAKVAKKIVVTKKKVAKKSAVTKKKVVKATTIPPNTSVKLRTSSRNAQTITANDIGKTLETTNLETDNSPKAAQQVASETTNGPNSSEASTRGLLKATPVTDTSALRNEESEKIEIKATDKNLVTNSKTIQNPNNAKKEVNHQINVASGGQSVSPTTPPQRPKPVKQTSHSVSPEKDVLTISVSKSLRRKLKEKAIDEGVSLDDFVSELLGEGLVLRAWEIAERKNAMKGPQSQQGNSNSYQNKGGYKQGGFKRGGGSVGGGNSKKSNYNRIMDDNANFLEYVRSQEKRRR